MYSKKNKKQKPKVNVMDFEKDIRDFKASKKNIKVKMFEGEQPTKKKGTKKKKKY